MRWTEHDSGRLLDMARHAAQLPEFDDGILGLAEEAVARIAELEATQTPERIAAWKLEGARGERERIVAWLLGPEFVHDVPACGEHTLGLFASWIRRGEHEKGGK